MDVAGILSAVLEKSAKAISRLSWKGSFDSANRFAKLINLLRSG